MNVLRYRYSKAFTLLETAIVIGILSLVLSGGLAMYRVQFVKERMDTTRDRLENIRTALADYKLKNNRLPCPALLTDDYTKASFGNEQPDCADSPAAAGTFRDTATPSGNPARIGAIPVNALGLTPEHMLDSWGRRFVYAVSEKLADDTYSYDSSSYNEAAFGAIRLLPPNGDVTKALGPIPDKTPFVVLSLGKAGDGGYTSAGKLFKTCPSGNAEEENCNFATNSTFRTGNFSDSENVADRFDDIVVNNIGNLSNISTDPMLKCGNKGMVYGPTATGADADGCVGGGACSDKGMMYSPTNPNKDSNGCIYPTIPTNTQFPNSDCKTATKNVVRYNGTALEMCNGTTFTAVGGGGPSGPSTTIVPKGTACPTGTTITSYNWIARTCSHAATPSASGRPCNGPWTTSGSCTTPQGWGGAPTTCRFSYTYAATSFTGYGCTDWQYSTVWNDCASNDYTQVTCTPN